jgi:uncharacterized protein YndB with AHSA1/START domain
MAEIRVERTLEAPIDRVFDVLADHEGYKRFRAIGDAKLVREGESERNGLGAIRELAAGPIRFTEEITAFERPIRLDYLIREVNLPLDHDGGSIRFEAVDDGTAVLWTSTFTTPVPVVGGALGGLMAAALKRGFIRMLEDAERLAS